MRGLLRHMRSSKPVHTMFGNAALAESLAAGELRNKSSAHPDPLLSKLWPSERKKSEQTKVNVQTQKAALAGRFAF